MGLFGGFGGFGGLFSGTVFDGGFSGLWSDGGGFSSGSGIGSGLSSIIRNPMDDPIGGHGTLLGELDEILEDAKKEFFELCTDGFVEMVIKGNKDYKTSYEIRDEADSRIGEANCKYGERCCEFNRYLKELNDFINALYRNKVKLAQRMGRTVQKLPGLPAYQRSMYAPVYSYTESTIERICTCIGLREGFDIKNRKECAKEYLEDAKDYETEVMGQIAKINRAEAFLEGVRAQLEEERMMIDALNDSLNMKRELEYLEIGSRLNILISEFVLEDGGKKNQRYLKALEQLKAIC